MGSAGGAGVGSAGGVGGSYWTRRRRVYVFLISNSFSGTTTLWLCWWSRAHLTFVVLDPKLYDPLTVGEFLAHTFHIGDSPFILLCMWASYSPRESLGMRAAQAFTMTPETKHSPTKRHRTDNAAYSQCQWNRRRRSDEEKKPSDRVRVVISCDSYASKLTGKQSNAGVGRKV